MNLLTPFQLLPEGIVVACLAGGLCGTVGVFVVTRGMSYIGHGLSHAVFGWAVISVVAGINIYLGSAIGALLSSLLIGAIARRRVIGADASIGVVTTAVFAIGVAIASRSGAVRGDLEAALFGNILGVGWADAAIVSAVAALVGVMMFAWYRPLLFSSFDPEVANISGVSVAFADNVLSIMLAGTVVAGMTVLGATLMPAALVIPPVVARLLTERFGAMLGLSGLLGSLAGLVGVYLSFYLDVSSGAAVVFVNTAAFALAYLMSFKTRQGSGRKPLMPPPTGRR